MAVALPLPSPMSALSKTKSSSTVGDTASAADPPAGTSLAAPSIATVVQPPPETELRV
jgi:hypothetical protein